MQATEEMLTATLGEIERILNTKTVVGEPIVSNGVTMIPLVSVGFGVGAGGGTGKAQGEKGEGSGGGAGGGGGVKPVAVLIIDQHGVRLESVKGAGASLAEKVVETVGAAIERGGKKKSES